MTDPHDVPATSAEPADDSAADAQIAVLGVLATGFEFRHQQTNGLHIGEEAGRRTHEELLELQRHAAAADPGEDPPA